MIIESIGEGTVENTPTLSAKLVLRIRQKIWKQKKCDWFFSCDWLLKEGSY